MKHGCQRHVPNAATSRKIWGLRKRTNVTIAVIAPTGMWTEQKFLKKAIWLENANTLPSCNTSGSCNSDPWFGDSSMSSIKEMKRLLVIPVLSITPWVDPISTIFPLVFNLRFQIFTRPHFNCKVWDTLVWKSIICIEKLWILRMEKLSMWFWVQQKP